MWWTVESKRNQLGVWHQPKAGFHRHRPPALAFQSSSHYDGRALALMCIPNESGSSSSSGSYSCQILMARFFFIQIGWCRSHAPCAVRGGDSLARSLYDLVVCRLETSYTYIHSYTHTLCHTHSVTYMYTYVHTHINMHTFLCLPYEP